jgi:hypothetical protein
MSANICRGTATSAIWKVTYLPWLTTFAPILISFSRRLVSDHDCAWLVSDETSKPLPIWRGTESSNPSPSSGESVANSVYAKAGSRASFRGLPKSLQRGFVRIPRLPGWCVANGFLTSTTWQRLSRNPPSTNCSASAIIISAGHAGSGRSARPDRSSPPVAHWLLVEVGLGCL